MDISEDSDTEELQRGSKPVGDGEQGRHLSDISLAPNLNHNHVIPLSEVSNGFDSSDMKKDNDISGGKEDAVETDEDDGMVTEDAGREDMFVDCPDELVANAESREPGLTLETEVDLKEKNVNILQKSGLKELENAAQDGFLIDNVEHLRDMLEKAVLEKESLSCELKEEREAFTRELASLRNQLKPLIYQHEFLGDNGGQSIEDGSEMRVGVVGEKLLVGDTSLQGLINECSQFLKSAIAKRLQTESTIEKLQSIIHTKDHEINVLQAKVAGFSESNDVFGSTVESIQKPVEVVMDRISFSLSQIFDQQELMDFSFSGKVNHVERCTTQLIEQYNKMLSEIDLLRQCLSGNRKLQDLESIFSAARAELFDLKGKEEGFVEKLRCLENDNRILIEQLENHRVLVETMKADIAKTKMEVEQERNKFSSTKEKLSMAVTKGKALVQQRDALKQLLADKTLELEKCLFESQEKSAALEDAELSKRELIERETLVASLQESLFQKTEVIEKFDGVLSQIDAPSDIESIDMVERLRLLVVENKRLKDISLELHEVEDVFSLVDLPEVFSSPDLKSRFSWLKESFFQAKDKIIMLQDELARTREAGHKEIDQLTESLLMELQEKNFLKVELDDLTLEYKEIGEKVCEISKEKDWIVKMLLEVSGVLAENNKVSEPSFDVSVLVGRSFQKIKEHISAPVDSSGFDAESFERIQTLLYVRDQDLMLHGDILEEELLELDNCSNKLSAMSRELMIVSEDKEVLLKDLERSEEKSAVLREKLSMAVKKGKGLVQDRENMKRILEEKSLEIEKLKHELESQESIVSNTMDQINKLSADAECIPKLEADLVAMKDERSQFEQLLWESNNMLQKVIKSLDDIFIPVDIVFEEPIGKVKWLAGYLKECLEARSHAEQEFAKVKDYAEDLTCKLDEALDTVKSLKDALSAAESNISQISEEKREVEAQKLEVEKKLQEGIDDANLLSEKFSEANSARNVLDELLSAVENKLTLLMNEKEEVQVRRLAAEMELGKAKDEVDAQTSKLEEAHKTIKLLEDELSELKENIAILTEQHNDAQSGRIHLEIELKKLQEEAGSQVSQLDEASATIKTLEDSLDKAKSNISGLEDSLGKAKSDISGLEDSRKKAEEEIFTLNSKLHACMEELAGTNGNVKSWSTELFGCLNDLQELMRDNMLMSSVTRCFEKKFKSLKEMELILKDIRGSCADNSLQDLQRLGSMEVSSVTKPFSDGDIKFIDIERDNDDIVAADSGVNISVSLRKTLEGFHLRNKALAYTFEDFSSLTDKLIGVLLQNLREAREDVKFVSQKMESLKQMALDFESFKQEQENIKQEQENITARLESEVASLLSACMEATTDLQFEVTNGLMKLHSIPELENLKDSMSLETRGTDCNSEVESFSSFSGSKHVKEVETLLFLSRRANFSARQFESMSNIAVAIIEDLQNQLHICNISSENALKERKIDQHRISELESGIEALKCSCDELSVQLVDYQAIKEKLRGKEEEALSLHNTVRMKEQETTDNLLSASEVQTLFDKIRGIEVSVHESDVEELGLYSSTESKKLLCIIDSVNQLQSEVKLLSKDNEVLRSNLSNQILETERLKQEVDKATRDKLGLEKMTEYMPELTMALVKIVNLLGGDYNGEPNLDGMKRLLMAVEKQAMAIVLESENSKSKTEELLAKLISSQKVVNELSTKVSLLEDSLVRGTKPQSEIVQERSIFEAPSFPTESESEISEIEDVGSVGKNAVSSVPSSSAHARTMRKGSSADHLTINIDTESDRLIQKREEVDEAKGHVFKSLNTSGLIPTHGKLIADRIDGIWVSGGRVLMSRPRARLGLLVYWIVLHMWLLVSVL